MKSSLMQLNHLPKLNLISSIFTFYNLFHTSTYLDLEQNMSILEAVSRSFSCFLRSNYQFFPAQVLDATIDFNNE